MNEAPALPAVGEPASTGRIASVRHTAAVLIVLAAWGAWSWARLGTVRAVANPNRLLIYGLSIAGEWALFLLVIRGAAIQKVTGRKWNGARSLGKDIAIAAVFWIAAALLIGLGGRLLHIPSAVRNLPFLLPRTAPEFAAWLLLSCSAGICEETVFRGYLQPQFRALTKSTAAGVALSALVFGAMHVYQGWRPAALVGFYGLLLGILAYKRGSVRPGMIAHVWQDSFTGIVGSFLLRRGLL